MAVIVATIQKPQDSIGVGGKDYQRLASSISRVIFPADILGVALRLRHLQGKYVTTEPLAMS